MLLLIILGLLAMFGLVAVAFVVLTGQAKRSARAAARFEQTFESPEQVLHAAALQVLRGSDSLNSKLWVHSLLEDVYGHGTIEGAISSIAAANNGQLSQIIECTFAPLTSVQPYELPGRVLTVTSGPAKGLSTHIIGYNPTSGKLQICAFKECSVSRLQSDGGSWRAVINGSPFGGLGFGFTAGGGRMGTGALKPGANEATLGLWGGANEDYDAVDYQNMLLALTAPTLMAEPYNRGGPVPVPIPSLHRPELVQHAGASRDTILRPMPADHPNFTGSNPAGTFNPTWDGTGTQYSWDVDNDGDGIPDSIWVDLGMPVYQAPDGRIYKRLFAILCEDLDGRLNVNAHGSIEQTDQATYQAQANTSTDVPGGGSAKFANGTPSGITQLQLPRGMGYGPAEINLAALFENPLGSGSINYPMYQALLGGNGTLDGRYGPRGGTMPARPGVDSMWDPLNFNKSFDYPSSYSGSLGLDAFYGATYGSGNPLGLHGYGCPPDVKGLMCVGLDLRGQPLYAMMGGQWANAAQDNPYEINLSYAAAYGLPPGAPIDNPFSVTEWERTVRPFDRDVATLPIRLYALGGQSLIDHRNETTPASWDMPRPAVALSLSSAGPTGGGTPPQSVVELFRRRFRSSVTSPSQEPLRSLLQGKLLAPELLAGGRMNVNRPWGDGLDGNGNLVVDEAQEAASEQFRQVDASGNAVTVAMDLTNGIDVNNSGGLPDNTDKMLARQLYARHLYLLMMMVADLDYLDGKLEGRRENTCRLLAQWAVNVVDARDRDSIMTCFEYDPDPFTAGWRADGNPATDDGIPQAHVVFGCERPELLITETLAFHNRRVEDLDAEVRDPPDGNKPGTKTTDTDDPDGDFDQRLRPQGSLFVELYNPWSTMEPQAMELCTNTAVGYGVDLKRRAPVAAGATAGAPVWRLVVVAYDDTVGANNPQPDLNDPDTTKRPEIERSIYFVDPSGTNVTDHGDAYYPKTTNPLPISPVLPGRYVVLGPGEPDSTGAKNPTTTYLGIKSAVPMQLTESEPDTEDPRAIILTTNGDPRIAGRIVMQQNGNYTLPWSNIQPPVVAVIDSPHRLSLTEPTDSMPGGYYATNGPTGVAYNEQSGGYAGDPAAANPGKPWDEPLDAQHDEDTGLWDTLRTDGVHAHFKVIHLQRLADPLRAYDKDANPYITIDSSAVDLTTFNGIDNDSAQAGGTISRFVTRERGEHNDPQNPGNLWRHEPEDQSPSGPGDYGTEPELTSYYFKKALGHTLGYLNYFLNPGATDTRRLPRAGPGEYKGDPQRPFPWLTWLNRPFVCPTELMLAPAERMSRLMHTYAVTKANPDVPLDPYRESPFDATGITKVPFPHLLNFFHSDKTKATGVAGTAPMFYRLLDFVCVPSPFVASEVQIPPGNAVGGTGHFFHPPFNRIPLYREPGRVNINTLFSPTVAEGVVNFFPGMWDMSLWEKFIVSRRGYGTASGLSDPAAIQTAMLSMNGSYPTRFGNPFRSFAGGYLVPPGMVERDEIEATLLRPEPTTAAANQRPLFDFRSTQQYNDTDQNPYFRYQALQRLSNLVTTRSNVYAVWITVGYFEATPAPSADTTRWPDGYQLGRELGMDTGEVKRHRAFYIFDRSIPVGFQRGKDLNVENAILLRRFIE